ncbi:probable disease resistance protein At1g15890 [Vitis riparia]|uniref:probable disease resistance protein At1g15890 n=1 Tax=Vitis riparia TaxID=96939 RepID=UPI00155A7D8E|nr:probable disease resistance protein At1g15890 [Vitis riparia]
MARWRTPQAWQTAAHKLKSNPSRFPGMEQDLFLVLACSYHNLPSDNIKSCFIYCSLFPKNHEIGRDQLEELWIGEGFLDEFDHIREARNQGDSIIARLQGAFLLRDGMSEKYVTMHDKICDMALWIAHEGGRKKKFVVEKQVELIEADEVATWKEAQRISLWDCSVGELKASPSFLNLETILMVSYSNATNPARETVKTKVFDIG